MSARQKKMTVLIVDDVPANIDILKSILSPDYKVLAAVSGEKAIEIAFSTLPPDIILLDIMMLGMDGYEVCRTLKSNERTKHIPVIFISALCEAEDEYKGLELGAVDYISKPVTPAIVKARVHNHLALKEYQNHLEKLVQERTLELELTQEATIESMAVLAEYRDPETGGHIKRTQNYIKIMAEHLRHNAKFAAYFDEQTIDLLYRSAPLHDIGKVGIPDNILLKPGKLTVDEFNEMKKHAAYGHDAIKAAEKKIGKEYSFLSSAGEIALYHHEKWDGSGYPSGLAGDDIPVSGRLMAIADVYDALISKRVYKAPFTHQKAVHIIAEGRGTHFDPDMVDAFLQVHEQFRQIALQFADFEEERTLLSS